MIDEIGARIGRSTCGGSAPADQRQLFGDDLARHEDVGAPVELDPDHRDADGGGRADAPDAGCAVDRGLDRET